MIWRLIIDVVGAAVYFGWLISMPFGGKPPALVVGIALLVTVVWLTRSALNEVAS